MRTYQDSSILPRSAHFLFLPAIVICLIVWLIPFLYEIYLSFTHLNIGSPSDLHSNAGLSNYRALFSKSSYFPKALYLTTIFTFACLLLEIFLGLFGALYLYSLNERVASKLLFFIIIPMIIAPSSVALIWYFQFNPDFGPLSIYLRNFGLIKDSLLSKNYAFPAVSCVDVWQYTPFMILMFYTGLRGIPKSIDETLSLDNVGPLRRTMGVYLPYISSILLIAIFLRVVGLLRTFDQIYILTGGGPGQLTEVLSLYAQRINYREFNFGIGSALGVVMNYAFLLVFTVIYRKLRIY